MKKRIAPIDITIQAIDGTVKVSEKMYTKLNRQVTNLTGKSVVEILNLITELTQQSL